ncbi:MAG: DNA repair protein RecN [Deltaproteobacteria bacterium]|jgi:DNA repair protein RecN (Recombination protein N)|nr:DNA repair protein RecN [Deltaproteobacteria bacterium]
MLTHLVIENLALVDRIDLELGPSLNVLTGETGAGKSVLVNALSLLLGARAGADVIRAGANEGAVEALFEAAPGGELAARLEAKGIDIGDGALVVRRTVSRSGKGRVLLNGQLATVSMLAEVLHGLLDVTSQHESVSLLDDKKHLDIVDAYGELGGLAQQVASTYAQLSGYEAALSALDTDEAEKARREDYLRFALEEIAQVAPEPGELEALETEKKRLKSAGELKGGVDRAEGTLYSDEGAVVELVGRVERELARLATLDERLKPMVGQAGSALAELEDLARNLSRYQGQLSADPGRLAEVEDRVELLRKLIRKHGGTIDSTLAAKEQLAAELDELDHEEARRADLLSALEAERERLQALATKLTAARQQVVRRLELAIREELKALSMDKTRLEVGLVPLAAPGPRGAESAELLISPNPGEPLRPLKKIASGGELSRILLAVKHVLAHRGTVGSYVFDEIDTGIGGAVADTLGKKLREVARSTQVICVTHLPQVAAYGEAHFKVEKREEAGRTVTRVVPLAEEERIEELARMLGGTTITERTRSLAEETLRLAQGEVPSSPPPAKAKAKKSKEPRPRA